MNQTKTNKSAARDAGHSISFAESVIIQANGDLSDKEFRRYISAQAEEEIKRGPSMPSGGHEVTQQSDGTYRYRGLVLIAKMGDEYEVARNREWMTLEDIDDMLATVSI